MSTTIDDEFGDGVATITLGPADGMNALDVAAKVALRDAVLRAADDPAVRAVVITGSDRAFCVGQDLREHTRLVTQDAEAVWSTVREHYNPMIAAIASMPKPVIAAVTGVAAGAGASLAFACDLRIVADTAGFNLAFTAIGLTADSGASWTLPRLVGLAKATELLLLSETVTAAQAAELGLATRVVPAAEVLPTAMELARRLAAGATVAYGAVKESLHFGAANDLAATLAKEDELQTRCGTTSDHLNAVDAFVNKRKPTFEGR